MKELLVCTLLLVACGDDDDDAPIDTGVCQCDGGVLDAAVVDAAPPDAPTADAGPSHALFGLLGGDLYRIDRLTASLTLVGPTGLGPGFIDADWDAQAGVARVMTTPYDAPTLSTIDLCTGAITVGTRLLLPNGDPLQEAEGLAIDPTSGTIYVGADANGSNDFLTEAVATFLPGTGRIAVLGTPDTVQDDTDNLTWIDGALYSFDLAEPSSARLYAISLGDGTATPAGVAPAKLVRVVYDPELGAMFGTTREDPRQLVVVSVEEGALTPIGATHTAAEHGGLELEALLVAPVPSCP